MIDIETNKLLGTIPSGYGSNCVAFSPDGEKGYITNFHSNDLTVFNKKTNEKITTILAGNHPVCVALTTDGQFALLSHESRDGIWVINTQTNQIVKKLSEGTGSLVNKPLVATDIVGVRCPSDATSTSICDFRCHWFAYPTSPRMLGLWYAASVGNSHPAHVSPVTVFLRQDIRNMHGINGTVVESYCSAGIAVAVILVRPAPEP